MNQQKQKSSHVALWDYAHCTWVFFPPVTVSWEQLIHALISWHLPLLLTQQFIIKPLGGPGPRALLLLLLVCVGLSCCSDLSHRLPASSAAPGAAWTVEIKVRHHGS